MFCSICGAELISPNQRFCTKCGSIISINLKAPQLKNELPQNVPTTISPATPTYIYVPVIQQKPVKPVKNDKPGPHSRKCLGFAITSIGLAAFDLIFGSGIFLITIMLMGAYFASIVLIIVVIIINIVGLLFGILSKSNSSEAEKLEPVNTVEKIGSVFGVGGIIFNIVSMAIAIIICVIIFFPPSFYYY